MSAHELTIKQAQSFKDDANALLDRRLAELKDNALLSEIERDCIEVRVREIKAKLDEMSRLLNENESALLKR